LLLLTAAFNQFSVLPLYYLYSNAMQDPRTCDLRWI